MQHLQKTGGPLLPLLIESRRRSPPGRNSYRSYAATEDREFLPCRDVQMCILHPGRISGTFGPFNVQHAPEVPISGPVLVHRYFSRLNRFCIRSPIVTWAIAGYTLSSIRRTSLTGSERRTTQRFSMRLPLTVRWTTGAAVGETSTESRDVSSRGVYFFLSKDVREGSPVEILPNEITLAGPVRVRCLGRVQRTEPREEGAVGVVAAIERYEFLRGDEEK